MIRIATTRNLLSVVLLASLVLSGSSLVLAATVTVAENNVEWAAANGDDISFIKPDTTGHIYIQDDALETTKLCSQTARPLISRRI